MSFISEGFMEARLFSFIINSGGEFVHMLTGGLDKLHDLPQGSGQDGSRRTGYSAPGDLPQVQLIRVLLSPRGALTRIGITPLTAPCHQGSNQAYPLGAQRTLSPRFFLGSVKGLHTLPGYPSLGSSLRDRRSLESRSRAPTQPTLRGHSPV